MCSFHAGALYGLRFGLERLSSVDFVLRIISPLCVILWNCECWKYRSILVPKTSGWDYMLCFGCGYADTDMMGKTTSSFRRGMIALMRTLEASCPIVERTPGKCIVSAYLGHAWYSGLWDRVSFCTNQGGIWVPVYGVIRGRASLNVCKGSLTWHNDGNYSQLNIGGLGL